MQLAAFILAEAVDEPSMSTIKKGLKLGYFEDTIGATLSLWSGNWGIFWL